MELQPQKSFVAVLFTGVSVSLWIWWRRRCLRRPPGGIWSLPVLGETLSYVRDPLGFMEEGSLETFPLTSLDRMHHIVLQHSEKGPLARTSHFHRQVICTLVILFTCMKSPHSMQSSSVALLLSGQAFEIWGHLQITLAVCSYCNFGGHR